MGIFINSFKYFPTLSVIFVLGFFDYNTIAWTESQFNDLVQPMLLYYNQKILEKK